jgi:mRNA interferase MazF
MNYARGDIILADLPYTDRTGSKVRPALVVQNNRNNARLDDVILAMITRTTSRSAEPTQLLIDVTTPSGQATGLLHTSAVKCEHLVTLHQKFVQRVIGHLPDALMQQINECLKESLGLK